MSILVCVVINSPCSLLNLNIPINLYFFARYRIKAIDGHINVILNKIFSFSTYAIGSKIIFEIDKGVFLLIEIQPFFSFLLLQEQLIQSAYFRQCRFRGFFHCFSSPKFLTNRL